MLKLSALSALLSASLLASATSFAQGNAVFAAQDPALVISEVENFLHNQASSYPGSALITVETPRMERQPACEHLEASLPSGQRLRSRMSVEVRCMVPQAWKTYVQANLSIQGYYYVSNRNIQPGDTLSLGDLVGREGDLLRLPNNVVFDPSQAIGYIATQRIPAGNTIKANVLRDPDSIQRGQTVRTVARGVGFVANGQGQALQSGSPGNQIQIKSSSGHILSATVINANTVQVHM